METKIAESKLKADCTQEIIKKMVELAEGFEIDDDGEFIEGVICPGGCEYEFEDIVKLDLLFPLLIHRAVEGWNSTCFSKRILILKNHLSYIYMTIPDEETFSIDFEFTDYQPESLTPCECACLHCLIEVLG